MMNTVHALVTATSVVAKGSGSGWNPFKQIAPSFGPFAPILESRVNSILALVWILALAYLAYRLLASLASLAKARRGRYGGDMDEAKTDIIWSGGALVAVAAVGTIYGTLVAF